MTGEHAFTSQGNSHIRVSAVCSAARVFFSVIRLTVFYLPLRRLTSQLVICFAGHERCPDKGKI